LGLLEQGFYKPDTRKSPVQQCLNTDVSCFVFFFYFLLSSIGLFVQNIENMTDRMHTIYKVILVLNEISSRNSYNGAVVFLSTTVDHYSIEQECPTQSGPPGVSIRPERSP